MHERIRRQFICRNNIISILLLGLMIMIAAGCTSKTGEEITKEVIETAKDVTETTAIIINIEDIERDTNMVNGLSEQVDSTEIEIIFDDNVNETEIMDADNESDENWGLEENQLPIVPVS